VAEETIRVPFTELRHLGGEFKTASQQFEQVVARLRQAVERVDPLWEGAAKDVFFEQYQQWEITLRQFVQLLDTVGGRLESITRGFEETDREVASRTNRT
jgi:WXG100 family type VII secretion target